MRQLLTPGEVMQLPADEEVVMLSGQPPIKAHKLRYYEDQNFAGRVLPPPVLRTGGPYEDRPHHRNDDWSGRIRQADMRLAGNTDYAETTAEDDGGLKRHPTFEEETLQQKPDQDLDALSLLDDDTDNPITGRSADLLKTLSPVQRAHEMTRGADEELKI